MNAKSRWLLIVMAGVLALPAPPACASEPVLAFLDALRGRRYFDEAFAYLDELEANEGLDPTVRGRVPYERAVTTLAMAAEASDPAARQALLARASDMFEQFCRDAADHPAAASARNQLAGILVERGRLLLHPPPPGVPATAEGRALFEQAREQLAESRAGLERDLSAMPKLVAAEQNELRAKKQQLSADLAQARILLAGVDFDLAGSYESPSDEAQKLFTAAAREYAALYEQYRTRAFGLLARLQEGRSYQALGQLNRAVGCFRELIELPDTADTRSIRTKSTRHALECWTGDSVRKYQLAIACGERWDKETGSAPLDADGLAIRYLTALACQEQAKSLADHDPARMTLVSTARQQASPVARQPGEYQKPAVALLAALQGNQKTAGVDAAPQKFADALAQARDALAEMQAAAQQLAAGTKLEEPARTALRKEQQGSAQRALGLLTLSLRLADAETPSDERNAARYYLCYLCWDLGRLYDAAVMGEFLADRYPATLFGRQGARIALASYIKLYDEAAQADRPFLAAQIERVADNTFRRWPDDQEAEEAALTLVNFAAASQQVEQVSRYLDKIPASSPRRAQAELRAGQALWTAYLRALRKSDEERPPADRLEALRKQAQEKLESGVARLEKSAKVDAALAAAVFSLAQMAVEAGQTDQAIAWLEQETFGPLTLVKSQHPAAARDTFAVETYKLALRAFVAARPQRLKEAEAAMNALEKLVADGKAAGAENLTAIYISLGRQLQQQLQELRKSGKTAELEEVSKSFEAFLDRAVSRESGSIGSLNWIGETYYSLGAGFAEDGPLTSERAKAYFSKATAAYQRMLEAAEKDPAYSQKPDALAAIRLRLADCYRRSGQFDKAIEAVAAVLNDRGMLLGAQVQAAEIYQAQGAADPKGYVRAIKGDLPRRDGQNLIWGWAKISKMTMNNDKFADTFHQARLNIAESRYRYALTQQDKATRDKVLEAAVQDLWSTFKLRPELGGVETAAQYDRTLKRIQKALGQQELGLAEFRQRDAGQAAAPN